jgi:hypothetical protein
VQAHRKHAHYCSCGRIIRGNAKANHRAMHERCGDGHRWLSVDAWLCRFAEEPREREAALRRFQARYPGATP